MPGMRWAPLTCRRGGPYLPAVDARSNISVPGAAPRDRSSELDSPAAWRRLAVATMLGTVGSVGFSAPRTYENHKSTIVQSILSGSASDAVYAVCR